MFFKSNKKYSGKPLQQTRKNGRENLMLKDKIDIKENNIRTLRPKTHDLGKEYARTQ
jgi:hypothetical protein